MAGKRRHIYIIVSYICSGTLWALHWPPVFYPLCICVCVFVCVCVCVCALREERCGCVSPSKVSEILAGPLNPHPQPLTIRVAPTSSHMFHHRNGRMLGSGRDQPTPSSWLSLLHCVQGTGKLCPDPWSRGGFIMTIGKSRW